VSMVEDERVASLRTIYRDSRIKQAMSKLRVGVETMVFQMSVTLSVDHGVSAVIARTCRVVMGNFSRILQILQVAGYVL
jgi:hypothetical protein